MTTRKDYGLCPICSARLALSDPDLCELCDLHFYDDDFTTRGEACDWGQG